MPQRILRGRNDSNRVGFWVSKPGFDVLTADSMQMAFSSDLKSPSVVITGQITINPAIGFKAKDNGRPGGASRVISLPFGRSINPMPFAVCIGKASSWTIPLVTGTAQLGYLANKFHTYVYENFTLSGDLTYGTKVNRWIPGSSGDADTVSDTWACCRFVSSVNNTALTITMNCASPLIVKYLVLDYNN